LGLSETEEGNAVKILLVATALSLGTLSSTAAGEQTADNASMPGKVEMRLVDKVPEGADKDDVIICKSVAEVGTKIPRRLCRTLAQWDRIAAENEAALLDNKRSSGQKTAAQGIDRSP
jgi:hypothetical protein